MPSSTATTSPSRSTLSMAATADRLIFGALVVSALMAVVIGFNYEQMGTALVVGGLLTAIVAAAALIAVHHIAFDRLQAACAGVYCLAAPDFLKIVAHAGYVVVQTGFEIYMAVLMRQAADAGAEMARLVDHMGSGERLALDVDRIDVQTPLGQSLRQALLRLNAAMVSVSQSAGNITTASSEVANGSVDLSQRTEQTARSED